MSQMLKKFKDLIRRGNYYVLDTETTAIEGEIVQIAIINDHGEILLDTLVKPQGEITKGAQDVHGISNDMVKAAPDWGYVRELMMGIIRGQDVVIYNASFDIARIHTSDRALGLLSTDLSRHFKATCAMNAYAEYHGEWNDYYGNYRWQKLGHAFLQVGGTMMTIGSAHSALGDCRMTLAVCKAMAFDEYE